MAPTPGCFERARADTRPTNQVAETTRMGAHKHHEFEVGQAVMLSARGRERIHTIDRDQCGVVIGWSMTGNACRIQFPGRKSPLTLHISYIEKAGADLVQAG
jgi:hypothetical protein